MASAVIEIVTKTCSECKESSVVTVPLEGFELYRSGFLIQEAFPDLSDDEREMLMTGTHAECWDKMFPADEGEYSEDDSFYDPSKF